MLFIKLTVSSVLYVRVRLLLFLYPKKSFDRKIIEIWNIVAVQMCAIYSFSYNPGKKVKSFDSAYLIVKNPTTPFHIIKMKNVNLLTPPFSYLRVLLIFLIINKKSTFIKEIRQTLMNIEWLHIQYFRAKIL